MNRRFLFAVLLTAVFLVPFFPLAPARADAAFAVDERRVLTGMERSWLQGYTPEISHGRLTLVLPIISPVAEGAIHGEVLLDDERLSPFPLQDMTATARRPANGVWALRFSLDLHDDRRNGDYPATLRIMGTDAQGDPLQTDIPYVFHIRDGQPNTEALRMELTEVQAAFRVGEDGCVTATLTNPCLSVTYEQVALRITDGSGDILPQHAGTLYWEALVPGQSVQVSFPMTVLFTATPSPHVLDFSLDWTALGQRVSQSESYTLPVSQDIRLEPGGLKMPTSVLAGDSVTLSLPLMNMGTGDVTQVLAALTLPGITERQSVLVGSIAPGETKTAQLTFSTGKELAGDFSGTLAVTCADSGGNASEFTLPVALTVEAPPAYTEASAAGPEEASPVPLYLLGGGCVLLLLLLVAQGALYRRKMHRMEEDRL